MKKIKCIIVDDEPLALDLLERYIHQTPFLELCGRAENAFKAMELLEACEVDIIFLDIQMPDLNGLEFSRTLKKGIKVVFTTAFEQYALESFKVDALDYLLKPFNYDEFFRVAAKIKEWHGQTRNTKSNPEEAVIFVRSEYKQLRILLKDVFYFEGLKDYVKIHIEGQTRPVLSLMSLKHLEEQLPSDSFMRVHRSFIIHLQKIQSVERGQVVINKFPITVAENYKERFQEYLNFRSISS